MRKIISKIPGFRTGKLWIKIIAILGYLFLFIIILGSLSLNDYEKITSKDKVLTHFQDLIFIIILFILPYVLILNVGGIRHRLPLFKKRKLSASALGWILIFVIIFVSFSTVNSALAKAHTPEYTLAKKQYEAEKVIREAKQKAERDAVKLAKKQADEQKKKEAAAKKVEEKAQKDAEKLAKKQADEHKKKEAAAKKLEEKAQEDAVKSARKQADEQKKMEDAAKKEAVALQKQQEEDKKAIDLAKQQETSKIAEAEAKRKEELNKKAEAEKLINASKDNFNKANEAFGNGKLDEALTLYSLVISSDPNYQKAINNIKTIREELYTTQCYSYEYREIKKNADNFKGKKAIFSAKITHIQELNNKTIIVLSTLNQGYGIWSDDVVITFNGNIDVYEGDLIHIYGEIKGKYTTNTQSIIKWLGVRELNIRYTLKTDPNAMPFMEAKYIYKY